MNIVNFVKYHIVAPEDTSILAVMIFNDDSSVNVIDSNPGSGYLSSFQVNTALNSVGKLKADVKKIIVTKNTKREVGPFGGHSSGDKFNPVEGIDLTDAINLHEYYASFCNGYSNNVQPILSINSNVEIISGSFTGWSSMTNGVDLTNASSLERIGNSAFSDWSSAVSCSSHPQGDLVIPSNVSEMGSSVFFGWTSMTKGVDFSNAVNLTVIDGGFGFGDWIQANPTSGILKLPPNITKISWDTETGHLGAEGGTFSNWISMTHGVDLSPNTSLTKIGGAAFSNWESANMSELYIPASVTSIEAWAFYNWKSMTGSLRFGSVNPPHLIDAATNSYQQFYGWDALPLGIEVFVPSTANLSVWKAELGKSPWVGNFKSINGTAWSLIP